MQPILEKSLRELDESTQLGECELVRNAEPAVSGVVRKGGTGEFVTVSVRFLDGREFLLSNDALDHLAKRTKVPRSLVAELPDELIRATLNSQLHRRRSDFNRAIVSETRVIAWMAPRWPGAELLPRQVIQACLDGMKTQDPMFLEPPRQGLRQQFLLTSPDLAHVFRESPRENDKHCFAVGVEIDYTGWKIPEVYPYGLRLVCTNGLIAPSPFRQSRREMWAQRAEDLLRKVRDNAADVVDFIRNKLIPSIERSIQRRPDDPDDRLQRVLSSLPAHVGSLVERAYRAERADGSDYHLMHAITRAANYPECPWEWQARLRTLAGELITGDRCPTCFQGRRFRPTE